MPSFYEFFAGGGMARAGLGPTWECAFANDFDTKKSLVYRKNWGEQSHKTADIRSLTADELPGCANLAWASFPCQDLSLAGGGAGLRGDRSGTFWPFWELMRGLMNDDRAPDMIILENVCGTLTSHGGKDFTAICSRFADAGYTFGAMVIDAARFLPQSRPRLFVIGVRSGLIIPSTVTTDTPSPAWHPNSLILAFERLPAKAKQSWVWWSLPLPKTRKSSLSDLIEESPSCVSWHTAAETKNLLNMMSPLNLAKVRRAKKLGRKVVGGIYRRTRLNEEGAKVQRAEVRFDDIAGCLRTPAGGSSRQLILVIEGEKVRSRLLSARETARLMGLPESYSLPENYNEAYHLTGDGVAVPVVRHLARNLIEPILRAKPFTAMVAA